MGTSSSIRRSTGSTIGEAEIELTAILIDYRHRRWVASSCSYSSRETRLSCWRWGSFTLNVMQLTASTYAWASRTIYSGVRCTLSDFTPMSCVFNGRLMVPVSSVITNSAKAFLSSTRRAFPRAELATRWYSMQRSHNGAIRWVILLRLSLSFFFFLAKEGENLVHSMDKSWTCARS